MIDFLKYKKEGIIKNLKDISKEEFDSYLNFNNCAEWLLEDIETDDNELKSLKINEIEEKINNLENQKDKEADISELYATQKYKDITHSFLIFSAEYYKVSNANAQGIDLIFLDEQHYIHIVEVKYANGKNSATSQMWNAKKQLKDREQNINLIYLSIRRSFDKKNLINEELLKNYLLRNPEIANKNKIFYSAFVVISNITNKIDFHKEKKLMKIVQVIKND